MEPASLMFDDFAFFTMNYARIRAGQFKHSGPFLGKATEGCLAEGRGGWRERLPQACEDAGHCPGRVNEADERSYGCSRARI